MVMNSVAGFVEELRETNLLRADQFSQLADEIAPTYENSQELAKHILRLGWITLYQAKKLLAGKGLELIVGHYVILEKIGEGGMGKVYKAKQLRLSRSVALKVVRPDLLSNETALKRFHREAKSAAQLAHPNIVRLFDADQVGDRHFLAMEFVEGADLAKLVKDSGPLPIGMASSFIRQAANGLQHAHDMGLVHRDIKPSNLLVTAPDQAGRTGSGGVVKILDMGLARAIITDDDESSLTALTLMGTVIGTPDYMSPEQAKNSSTVDGRSDLYSLGCTFYFLLTGHVPFPTGSTLEKLLQHQMDPPPPIQLLRQDTPDELAAILHHLLNKRAEDRFQSGAALATALEPWSVFDGSNRRLTLPTKTAPVPQALPLSNATIEFPPNSPTQADPFDFDEMAEPTPVRVEGTETVPEQPRKKLPIGWMAGIAGGLCLLLAGFFIARNLGTKETPQASTAPPKEEPVPLKKDPVPVVKKNENEMAPLGAYLPADTVAVIVLNIPNLAKSSFFQNRLKEQIAPALAYVHFVAKFNPMRTIERVLVAIPPEGGTDATLILQGHDFLTSDLLRWITTDLNGEMTKERNPGGQQYAIYEFHFKPNDPATYLAILNERPVSIAISSSKERIFETMARADELSSHDGRAKTKFEDPSIPVSLARYEHDNSVIWACIGTQFELPGKKSLSEDFGITNLILNVRLSEGMNFDAFIEAGTFKEASVFFTTMQEVLKRNLGENPDSRVVNLVNFVAKVKPQPGAKKEGKSATPFTLHVHRYLSMDEFTSWLKPFIGELPMMNGD